MKKLSQKFGGGGVLGKVGSFVMARFALRVGVGVGVGVGFGLGLGLAS